MPSKDKRFPTFREFIDSVTSATPEAYLEHPDAKVSNEEAFREMHLHIARLYEGVEVTHSFADENGQIFDCVPIEQQPSVRRSASKIAEPPDLPSEDRGKTRVPGELQVEPQLRPDQKDQYGNTRWCPPGTIPMRRITLEELMRFESLDKFFRKSPLGNGRHPRLSTPQAAAATHKYAHAYQVTNNLGGHSFLNVWDPAIGTNQIFSLSQHWYAGGSGPQLQTVEAGWQVYPAKYGNTKPCLFIYWTADDYQHTGCYNLDCSAFVQTSSVWTLGGTLSPVSTTGGTQYELEFAWYLYQGNWWLYLKGTSASNTVGYYPTSIYKGGQLASHATDIDYGGETVGTASWPPMGGGAFASTGWQHAAYQRDIYYFPSSGGSAWASLTPVQNSPSCYTIALKSTSPPWGVYFWFGGPGGTSC